MVDEQICRKNLNIRAGKGRSAGGCETKSCQRDEFGYSDTIEGEWHGCAPECMLLLSKICDVKVANVWNFFLAKKRESYVSAGGRRSSA